MEASVRVLSSYYLIHTHHNILEICAEAQAAGKDVRFTISHPDLEVREEHQLGNKWGTTFRIKKIEFTYDLEYKLYVYIVFSDKGRIKIYRKKTGEILPTAIWYT